jgi:hypothetical protein
VKCGRQFDRRQSAWTVRYGESIRGAESQLVSKACTSQRRKMGDSPAIGLILVLIKWQFNGRESGLVGQLNTGERKWGPELGTFIRTVKELQVWLDN